ncbi:MAG: DUF3800 domain-containing protein [Geminicoccaceae bacterium]
MHILYVDESGDLGAMPAIPDPKGNDQPVFVIGGLIIDANKLESVTQDFLNLKGHWFPGLDYPSDRHLDKILPEIKGSDLRKKAIRSRSRNVRRQAIGFLDHLIRLLQRHDVRLVARIWIKGLGEPFIGQSVYTSSIQGLLAYFDHFLTLHDTFGFCIADSRDYEKNVNVAHSIFTQKYQLTTSIHGRLLDLPTFAHSQNHAGIQMCDIICSAVLYPVAAEVYCSGVVENVHVQPMAASLRQRFGPALKAMQHRYQEPSGRWVGGVMVADALRQRNGSGMFQ